MKALTYTKMFAVWFTVGTGIGFISFAVAILPGVNLPGIPIMIVVTLTVHLALFFWIMWTYIMEPEPPKVEYEDDYEIGDPWY
jgi:hypothetical protein